MTKNINKILLLIFILTILASSISAFDFYGYTYNTNKTILPYTNVTIKIYNLTNGFEIMGPFYSELSDSDGFFNITLPDYDENYLYGVSLYLENSTNIYVSKPIPEFPASELNTVSPIDFYLYDGVILNISVINNSGAPVNFSYQIKDDSLGFPIDEDFEDAYYSKEVYVIKNRNYTVMTYPYMTMPRISDVTNLSLYSDPAIIDVVFNTTEDLVSVSGYVDYNTYADFDSLEVIPILIEAGNGFFYDYSTLFHDMAQWDGSHDEFNKTSGFYNITLPAVPNGINIMLLFAAENNTADETYGMFKNITLNLLDPDVTEFNVSLEPMLGEEMLNITLEDALNGPDYSVIVPAVNFTILNESNVSIIQSGFIEFDLDYSSFGGTSFKVYQDLEAEDQGNFVIPLLNSSVDDINIFTANYAPRGTDFSASELDQDIVNISLRQFNPGAIDKNNFTDVFIEFLKSTPECNVPNPGDDCYLMNRTNMTNFNPLSAIMGGGEISFRMGRVSTGVVVQYTNADLLASGPPDVLFDGAANSTTNSNSFEDVWRFGSSGPEIYDSILLGMPIDNESYDLSQTINATLSTLYDEDWNVIWNVADNGTNPGSVYDEYSDYNISLFEGINCSTTNSSELCFINTTTGMVWIQIPHFSGVAPTISGVPDLIPPSSVTNLINDTVGAEFIYWTWTNPLESDFNSTLVYIDGVNVINTSNNYYNATGLTALTNYTISLNTQDNNGNINISSISNKTETLPDTTAPSPITGLTEINKSDNYIYWNWTNPSESDFAKVIIYLNDENIVNTTNNYYNATGLNYSTSYNLTLHTMDVNDNLNDTDVTSIVQTLADTTAPILLSNSSNSSVDINQNIIIETNWNEHGINQSNMTLELYYSNDTLVEAKSVNYTQVNFTYLTTMDNYNSVTFYVKATDGSGNIAYSSNLTTSVSIPCGTSIVSDLTLKENLSCSVTNALILSSDNIVLDCNNYTIDGLNQSSRGIFVNAHNNITIKNCIIKEFEDNVVIANSWYSSILNNIITESKSMPNSNLHLDNFSYGLISGNTLSDSIDGEGIYLLFSNYTNISSNTISNNNKEGINLITSTNIRITSNTISSNEGDAGIRLSSTSDDVLIKSNTLIGNANNGIYSEVNKNLTIDSNTIQDTSGIGIDLIRTDNGTVSNNIIKNNDGSGIYLINSADDNVISDNTLNNNTYGILIDNNTISSNNLILNNDFSSNINYSILSYVNPVIWNLTSTSSIINGDINITGDIEFNGGLVSLFNSTIYLNDTKIAGPYGNLTITKQTTQQFVSNNSTVVEANESDANLTFTLGENKTFKITVSKVTPTTAPTSYTALKGIEVTINDTLNSSSDEVEIRIYYNDTELSNANIDEDSLKLYYYNTTSSAWQLESNQGVNTGENYVWAKVNHFSQFATFGTAPVTTESSSSSSSSHSSSSTIVSQILGNGDSKNWARVNANETKLWTILNSNISVNGIEFKAKTNLDNLGFKVTQLIDRPQQIDTKKNAFKYLKIDLIGAVDDDLYNTTIKFNVDKSWVEDNNYNPKNINLYRWVEDNWQELKTELIKEDTNVLNYEAQTPGFSFFVAAVNTSNESTSINETTEGVENNKTTTRSPSTEDMTPSDVPNVAIPPDKDNDSVKTPEPKSNTSWITITIILLLVIVGLFWSWKQKHK